MPHIPVAILPISITTKTMKITYNFIRILIISFTFIVSFTNCSPEDGRDGLDGLNGEQGPQGEPGQDGNANVISRTFWSSQITWNQTSLYGINYLVAELEIPEITQAVVENGVVLVYGSFFWGQPWSAIPVSYYENGKTNYFSYGIKIGTVTLRTHRDDNTLSQPTIAFRIVTIEGIPATGTLEDKSKDNPYHGYSWEEIKAMDYGEIAKAFNISD